MGGNAEINAGRSEIHCYVFLSEVNNVEGVAGVVFVIAACVSHSEKKMEERRRRGIKGNEKQTQIFIQKVRIRHS